MSDHAGKLQVYIRCRPLSPKEKKWNLERCISFPEDKKKLVISPDKTFSFDYVFDEEATQDAIFEDCVRPLVMGCFLGYNATVFAYGQTGSGKTFTMGSSPELLSTDNEGIIPRAIKLIYLLMTTEHNDKILNLRVSFIEIYNEEMRDLLHPKIPSRDITIREDEMGRICYTGAKEEDVRSVGDVLKFLAKGSKNRTTGDTLMNDVSSRSHAIFTISMETVDCKLLDEQMDSISPPSAENGNGTSTKKTTEISSYVAKLHLVDLAGCERAKRTGAVGVRLKESVGINQGLLALGKVIRALSASDPIGGRSSAAHYVPYRESKLTRFLQDSIGGNSRTAMIACISPLERDKGETVNTLQYATRARTVENKVKANVSVSRMSVEDGEEYALLQAHLKGREISELNAQELYAIICQGSSTATAAASRKIGSLEAELAQCREDLHRDEELFSEKMLELKNTKRSLREMEETNRTLREAVHNSEEKFQSEISRLNHENNELKMMVLRLEEQLGQQEERFESLLTSENNKAESLRSEVVAMSAQLKTATFENDELKITISGLESDLAAQQKQYQEQIESEAGQTEGMREEIESLKNMLGGAVSENDDLKRIIIDLESNLETQEQKFRTFADNENKKLELVRLELSAADGDLKEVSLENDSLKRKVSNLEADLKHQQMRYESLSVSDSDKIDSLRSEITALDSSLKSAVSENDELRRRIADLESEMKHQLSRYETQTASESSKVESLRAQLMEIDKQLNDATQENITLIRRVEVSEAELSKCRQEQDVSRRNDNAKMDELRTTLEEVESQLELSNQEIEKYKQKEEQMENEMQRQVAKYEDICTDSNSAIATLQSDFEDMENKFKDSSLENEELKKSIATLESELDHQINRYQALSSDGTIAVESLRSDLLEAENKLRDAVSKNSDLTRSIASLEEELDRQVVRYQTLCSDDNQALAELKNELNEAETKLSASQSENSSLKDSVKRLEEEIDLQVMRYQTMCTDDNSAIESLKFEIVERESELKNALSEIEGLRNDLSLLQSTLQESKQQYEEVCSESDSVIGTLRSELQEVEEQLQEATSENENLKGNIVTLESELADQIVRYQTLCTDENEAIEKIRVELNDATRKLELSTSENNELKEANDRLQSELNNHIERYEDLLSNENQAIMDLTSELSDAQSSLQDSQSEITALKNIIANIESELEHKTTEYETKCSDDNIALDEAKNELERLRSELHSSNSSNMKLKSSLAEVELELRDQISKYEKLLSDESKSKVSFESKLVDTEEKLQQVFSENGKLRDHIVTIETALADQISHFDALCTDEVTAKEKLQEELITAKNELHRSVSENKELKDAMSNLEWEKQVEVNRTKQSAHNELSALERKNKELERSNRELAKNIEHLENELEYLNSSQVEVMKVQVSSLEKELQTQVRDNEGLRSTIEELELEKRSLRDQATRKKDMFRNEISEMDNEVSVLKEENGNLRETVANLEADVVALQRKLQHSVESSYQDDRTPPRANGFFQRSNGFVTKDKSTSQKGLQRLDSLQRRITQDFSNRLSVSPTRGIDKLVHIADTKSSPVFQEKDAIVSQHLAEWISKSTNIAPSVSSEYANLLVRNGQGSVRRLHKTLQKDGDFLLSVGIPSDDERAICGALIREMASHTSSLPEKTKGPVYISPSKVPDLMPTDGRTHFTDRLSLSPPPFRIMEKIPEQMPLVSDEVIRAEYSFRESRLARLESQASRAAKRAKEAVAVAESVSTDAVSEESSCSESLFSFDD
mmetsp:Transcript_1159/g.1881  ORF Transcript_1159/g.1881 Transcript_1159/m.1881 type:complete len:1768 (-) Transcript_1159:205-5508(-)|eukprot:CAMPEP_0185036948 /NCGR_PEP_ID=MMETSP1103-20130426/30700_1 /TAXON_ID=36769 /ORGANISM="Paraphysomonas bandaiensis, Strain Caron Lab Isolate" /LENGTH=1767 /DNA_ID=CAMNT_0027574721 /DNA_START=77 /DNA_END=5380 /DNA_ORIENTATION=+